MPQGQSIFGQITPPDPLSAYSGGQIEGISLFISNIIKTIIAGAGIYALVSLVIAGYMFISAGDDTKKVAAAWSRIYQTVLGLAIAAGSFVLASIFGQLIFKDPGALLQLKIFTPTP